MPKVIGDIAELVMHWSRDRRVGISAGVFLVLVPTLFSVFPNWTSWPAWIRALIIVLWLLVALFVVAATARQSAQVEDLVGQPLKRRHQQRYLSGSRLIRLHLTQETGLPDHYEFRVFLFDSKLNRLVPSYGPHKVSEHDGWEVGQGVTGVAWQKEEYVLARGDDVSNDTHGLTAEQQEQYKHLQVVAAMPVTNAREHVIAVLTGSSENDDGQLASNEGREKQQELAQVVARILIDVLQARRD
jgi:hypothetical protein